MSHSAPTLPHGSPSDPLRGALARRDWLVALGVAFLAMLVRVLLSGHKGFWLDEYYTLRAAQLDLPHMIRERLSMGHSPLYFLYAKLWLSLGHAEWILRLSSALAVAATVLLMTGLAGAMGLRRHLPALWAISLIHPYWIAVGTQYRYMMPVIATAAATGWAAMLYADGWRPGRGLLLAALTSLLLWLHASTQIYAIGLLAFLLWQARASDARWRPPVFYKAWPVALGILSSLPLAFLLRDGNSEVGKAGAPHVESLLKELCEMVFDRWDLWSNSLHIPGFFLLAPQFVIAAIAIWLTRRELLARERPASWRFLAALMAGTLLAIPLITLLVAGVQGAARYLSFFSVPLTLCLAVAWSAPLGSRWRFLFRFVLAALLLIQASASIRNRGDLHREAIQWLIVHNSGREKVVVSSPEINRFALGYFNFPHPELIATLGKESKGVTAQGARRNFRKTFNKESRGFVLLYHDRFEVDDWLGDLEKRKYIIDARRWQLSHNVIVYALIRRESERAWLNSLPAPQIPWGPARGD